MVKIRIHGSPEEVAKATEKLKEMPGTKILSESDNYPDRGKSTYVRRYIDVDFELEEELKVRANEKR